MKQKKVPQPTYDIDLKLIEIGAKVRELRRAKDANYEHFAFSNDLNKVSLSRLERGDNITLKLLIRTLQSLDVSLESFFAGL
jgi:transcriptional regulator with XRE-family HTH domain